MVYALNPSKQRRHRAKKQSAWGGKVRKGFPMGRLGRIGRVSHLRGGDQA